MKKRVVVLGATGSIGQNALDIIRAFPQYFELSGFSYHINTGLSSQIASEFPASISMCTDFASSFKNSSTKTGFSTFSNKYHLFEFSKLDEILTDKIFSQNINDGLEIFKQFFEKCAPDIVLNGIAGSAGLLPSYACLSLGVDLALANKESIVMAYDLLKDIADKTKANIIPVDSEHWAIFQLLNMAKNEEIEKLIITASGGAFRDVPAEELNNVSLENSFNHPTWKMGRKITIDSATLANKALEVIEATKLFRVDINNIIVTVHKESIVHSMVQSVGGSIYAQLSPPDMRCPIFGALMFPIATPKYLKSLDFSDSFSLSFSPPRIKDFPMLKMGGDVAKLGYAYPIAFNAANEIAVEAFMNNQIKFMDIARIVEVVLQNDWYIVTPTLENIYQADMQARKFAYSSF